MNVTMNAVPVPLEFTERFEGAAAGPSGVTVTAADSGPTQPGPYARTANCTGTPTGNVKALSYGVVTVAMS